MVCGGASECCPFLAGFCCVAGVKEEGLGEIVSDLAAFPGNLVAQMVKNLSSMQETWVRSLGQEDPLEKEMATQSSNLAWIIPWTEEPGSLQSMVLQRVRHGHD